MLRERLYPAAPGAGLFEACYGLILVIAVVVVFITIVVMMVVMLPGMFAMPLATALIMPMHPSVMVFPPIPGYPHPFVAIVPIARTIGIIRPITNVDREPDRHGAGPDSACKQTGEPVGHTGSQQLVRPVADWKRLCSD